MRKMKKKKCLHSTSTCLNNITPLGYKWKYISFFRRTVVFETTSAQAHKHINNIGKQNETHKVHFICLFSSSLPARVSSVGQLLFQCRQPIKTSEVPGQGLIVTLAQELSVHSPVLSLSSHDRSRPLLLSA